MFSAPFAQRRLELGVCAQEQDQRSFRIRWKVTKRESSRDEADCVTAPIRRFIALASLETTIRVVLTTTGLIMEGPVVARPCISGDAGIVEWRDDGSHWL